MRPLTKQEYLEILDKYLAGTASEEEKQFLDAYYHSFDLSSEESADHSEEDFKKLESKLRENIEARIFPTHKKNWINKNRLKLIPFAAVFFIIFFTILYFSRINTEKPFQEAAITEKNYSKPGSEKAILTLSDGEKILLDSSKYSELIESKDMVIRHNSDGTLHFQVKGSEVESINSRLNTIETPAGGQYSIMLADGTKVWLNAFSTLRFPSKFSAGSRIVELEGEGYFEVAKVGDSKHRQPFIVRTDKQEVEVLGTHFNINAYQDETEIKTTLVEGSVKIKQKGFNSSSVVLHPNQQSILSRASISQSIKVIPVDPLTVLDWKNGNFLFDADDLPTIMRKVSRWYQVEIRYEDKMPSFTLGGQISRKKTLEEVLAVLSLSGDLNFKVQGNQVYVKKK